MTNLAADVAAFLDQRAQRSETARMTAGLRVACGIDLEEALRQPDFAKRKTILRLTRLVERERLAGARGQPGYDLNRHLGLKQSLDRLRAAQGSAAACSAKENGALGRRSKRSVG